MCEAINGIMGKTPEDLLKGSHQINAVPVDLSAILEKAKISVIPSQDFSEYEQNTGRRVLGALATKGDSAAIFYNEKEPSMTWHRIRFTVAHELAHACLSGDKFHIAFRYDDDKEGQSEEEINANIFAGALLIPKKSLLKQIEILLIPTISLLADAFDVSRSVMEARLKFLGLTDMVLT